jgi:hypothetical protein
MDYVSYVQKPDTNLSPNPFTLINALSDSIQYVKGFLISGKDCKKKSLTLGDRYFFESGSCDDTSVTPCRGESRYIYVDNVPSPMTPCVDPSQPVDPTCAITNNTGIINGLLGDLASINPAELIYGAVGKGSIINTKCALRREKVGYESNGDKHYTYETRCSPEKKPLICSIEFFNGQTTKKSRKGVWINFSVLLAVVLTIAISVYRKNKLSTKY